MLVFNTINECRSGTEGHYLLICCRRKSRCCRHSSRCRIFFVAQWNTYFVDLTISWLTICSYIHSTLSFTLSIFSLCGHFYFGCSKCSIPWCRNYWHLAPTFNIFSFVLLFDAAYSSHCSIFFVSSRSSTTCVCRDATTLFLSFTSAMVYQVASSYDCVVATLVIWSGWRHALTPQHT